MLFQQDLKMYNSSELLTFLIKMPVINMLTLQSNRKRKGIEKYCDETFEKLFERKHVYKR